MDNDMWLTSVDRMLGLESGQSDRSVRSAHSVPSEGVQRLYFLGGLLCKPHGQLKLQLLYIFIDIATL
jgi:hypothetical protein